MLQRFSILMLLLVVTACAAPLGRERDNRSMSSLDTCTAACNRDSDLCTDEPSNSREPLQGVGRTFTTGRQCGLNLGNCLDRCKAL